MRSPLASDSALAAEVWRVVRQIRRPDIRRRDDCASTVMSGSPLAKPTPIDMAVAASLERAQNLEQRAPECPQVGRADPSASAANRLSRTKSILSTFLPVDGSTPIKTEKLLAASAPPTGERTIRNRSRRIETDMVRRDSTPSASTKTFTCARLALASESLANVPRRAFLALATPVVVSGP